MRSICCRCKEPLKNRLKPGQLGMHESCYAAACEQGGQWLEAKKEQTFRVVGVRDCGVREVLSLGLDRKGAEGYVARCAPSLKRQFPRYEIEPEVN